MFTINITKIMQNEEARHKKPHTVSFLWTIQKGQSTEDTADAQLPETGTEKIQRTAKG